MISIGIDVGGTSTRVALIEVTDAGSTKVSDFHNSAKPTATFGKSRLSRILKSHKTSTIIDANGDGLIDWLASTIRDLLAKHRAPSAPIGLALPGLIDRDNGCLTRSVNLPFLENRPIVAELSHRTGQRVSLWTDADAATWGEYSAIDPPRPSFVHLRIGTGIACGAIKNGCFVIFPRTGGGHLDALVVDKRTNAPLCKCGKRGCLEAIASGAAIQSQWPAGDLPSLQRAFETGDDRAIRLINACADAIASTITSLAELLSPSAIVLGGGAVEQLPALIDTTNRKWETRTTIDPNRRPAILPAKLADDAGVVGAAILAIRPARSVALADSG